jgi:glycosyltransferase involved in cell wall biosynthesis
VSEPASETRLSAGRVAIVVPCYESARYLRNTVLSVLAQTRPSWTLVVVDDGSTDNPEAEVADLLADSRIRLISQSNLGVAAARNRGVRERPPSDYLLFLDADDLLEPAMLETLCSWLDRHQGAAAAYCQASLIDEGGNPLTSSPWAPTRLRPSRLGIEAIPDDDPMTPFVSIFCRAGIVPSTVVMRRSVYEQTPGWDEAFGQHYEDTLLFLHLALRGQIHFVAKALVRRRRHEGQSTSQPEKFKRQERKLYDAWRSVSGLTPDQAEVVRKAWQFRERRRRGGQPGARGFSRPSRGARPPERPQA